MLCLFILTFMYTFKQLHKYNARSQNPAQCLLFPQPRVPSWGVSLMMLPFISHCFPLYPQAHLQTKESPTSVQFPPL